MSEGVWTEWTLAKENKFLKSLVRTGGNVSAACRAVRLARSTVYNRKDNDPDFSAKWSEAIQEGTERLEAAAYERAVVGVVKRRKPIFDENGVKIGVEITREWSDSLAALLLKARNPAKYRETIRQELTGPDGKPIESNVRIFIPDNGRGDRT